MIKLKIQGASKIRTVILYLEKLEDYYENEIAKKRTGSNDQLIMISYLELIQNLLRKLKISQINGKVKITVDILKITALVIVFQNKLIEQDVYSQNVISELTVMLHKQLINQ
jgi:hypothetical protein